MPRKANRVELTDAFIKKYRTDKNDDAVWDSKIDGFGVRCRNGTKRFVFRYSVGGRGGRQYRMSLGPTDSVKLSAARKKAKDLRAKIDLGGDPKAEIQAKVDADNEDRLIPTLNELSLRYLNEHALHKKNRFEQDVYRLRRLGFITADQVRDFGVAVFNDARLPDQKREYGRRLSKFKSQKSAVFPGLAKKRIDLITENDISRLHSMGSSTQTEANRRREVIRKMFNIAQGWYPEAVTKNPAIGQSIASYDENERERFLTKSEIARLIQSLYSLEAEGKRRHGTSVNAIRIILFTGARPGEVFKMKWDQLDLDEGVWSKPASTTKQKRRHHVPLVQDAITLLKHILSQGTDSEYVFPSRNSPARPIGEVRKTWAKIIETAEIKNEIGTRLYDLRHTFATHLVASGQSLFSVGKLLGHSTTKVTERYAHADLDGLRVALGSMDQVFSDASNVTPLQKG